MSPSTTILRIPEKLVLEVRVTGRYDFIEWFRNGDIQGVQGGSFNPTVQQLPHYNEIYVQQTTSATDLGVYEVTLSSFSGLTPPPRIEFAVVAPGMSLVSFTQPVLRYFLLLLVDANTTISDGFTNMVTVVEGGDVDISCTSTGVPVPTITWTLNNQTTPFSQTDVSTDFSIRIERDSSSNLVPVITSGNLVSTLHIVNAQYPSHDGVYECTGDSDTGGTSSHTITLTVQIPGKNM